MTQAQGGQPFSITDGNDYAGVGPGAGSQLWAATKKVHIGKNFGSGGWFDPTAFSAHPVEGTFSGRGARNQWYNPGFQSWNIAAEKHFHVIPGHDTHEVIFRGEAFNFTNHPNYDDPNTTPGSSNFGLITTKGGTYASDRELQFSLRYAF